MFINRILPIRRYITKTNNFVKRIDHLDKFFFKVHELIPVCDVLGGKLVRIGNKKGDGGYVMLDEFDSNNIAYSFGICDDVSWDKDIVSRGIHCYMYDHTISHLPENNDLFHWQKKGIGGVEAKSPLFSLERLIIDNGHLNNNKLILKIDVEGAERESLLELPNSILEQFEQIVIELHNLSDREYAFTNLSLMSKLLETHTPIHIHANNCAGFTCIDDLIVPDALEVTYVRTNDHKFRKSSYFYPREIDVVNTAEHDDIIVGLWNIPSSCFY